MRSAQDIFTGDFSDANTAVVQKLRPDEHNLHAQRRNFTEHWDALKEPYDLMVLSVGERRDPARQILDGFITDVQPSLRAPDTGRQYYRIYVDRFQQIGTHDRTVVPDASFYGNGGGGGARVIVQKATRPPRGAGPHRVAPSRGLGIVPEGAMERRLVWIRKNHEKFRDPVWQHWEGKCAVSDSECEGLLVASHIFPWSRSTPREKTDVNNGLLLSVPLDKLFDQGLISFSDKGVMLVKDLPSRTRELFGLSVAGPGIASRRKLTASMRQYLARHRALYGF